MGQEINIYCDESCHLPNDRSEIMVLGAVWCPKDKAREINIRLAEKKVKHGLPKDFEVKWIKVSPKKIDFYIDLIDYFFDDDDLNFRGIVTLGKNQLDHSVRNCDHDTWYYKMLFLLISNILNPEHHHRIFLDRKDTLGPEKITKLCEVLRNSQRDFDRKIIGRVEAIRSLDTPILQLCDLIIGALSYLHRGLGTSGAKLEIIRRIQERSNKSLKASTLLRESKFNLFLWSPGHDQDH